MQISSRIKRLIIIALAVIILALASADATEPRPEPEPRQRTPYPLVPSDIDPRALDSANPIIVPPSKVPVPLVRKPEISAEAYLVAHLETGQIYSEYNSGRVFPIASLSKLITALVALHDMNPDQKITITQPMLDAYGEAGRLALGETFTLSELLYPLLLESSNDAAEAIAQTHGYAEFIQKMNAFATGLGMTSTSFRDASGLSSGNVSNARDLLSLASYLHRSEKNLLELTRQTVFVVASTTEHGAHVWKTINPFPLDPHFMGGKTGRTTEAKESMVSLFRYESKGKTYPVAVIVLRSDFSAREIDSSILFERFIRRIEGEVGVDSAI